MNRVIISQRITSILGELSRLTSTLYAMNMADIQKYPENYEVLSTDAALRAEQIACRLRHLIYSTTSIKKTDTSPLPAPCWTSVSDMRTIFWKLLSPACCPRRCSINPVNFCLTLCTTPSAGMQKTTHFPNTVTASSAFPMFIAANSRTEGCGITTIWNSSVS